MKSPRKRRDVSSDEPSYKYQRVREELRAAIVKRQLTGKLPGERPLAKRFEVNAKTIGKALADLQAEGLLDRSVGRGTYVRDGTRSTAPAGDRWIILCDPDQEASSILEGLLQFNPSARVVIDPAELKPGALGGVNAVISLSINTPDRLLRDLVIRRIKVVLVGTEPRVYSVNAVLADRTLGASCLAREMMLCGHRRFLAVERRGNTAVALAIRSAARLYAPESIVDSVFAADVPNTVREYGATGIICDSRKQALLTLGLLEREGIRVPEDVSIGAIGSGPGDFPCTGYFVLSQQKAATVADLIHHPLSAKPQTIWLTGAYHDGKTIGPREASLESMDDTARQFPRAPE